MHYEKLISSLPGGVEQTFLLCSLMEKGDDAGNRNQYFPFPYYFPLLDTQNLMKKHRYSQFQVKFVLNPLFILAILYKCSEIQHLSKNSLMK